jgi:hypothetical protein
MPEVRRTVLNADLPGSAAAGQISFLADDGLFHNPIRDDVADNSEVMASWFESKCRMRLLCRRFLRHALMLILFVADLFHPLDNLAVELFLNGDVRHGRGRCSPMPVLLAGRKPDHITGPDLLDRSAVALKPPAVTTRV